MSLVEYNLFGEKLDKVQRAIDIVRSFEPPEGYYLADSGGKDSTATKAILRMAGVKFESHYNVTTVDPPELVCFVIRQNEAVIYDMPEGTHKYFIVQDTGKLLLPVSPDAVVGKRTIHFSIPKYTMRELIVKKQFPPTRLARYCCEKLKKANGEGRVVVTGVRWAESLRRKNNQGLVTIFNGKAAKVAEEQGVRYTDNRARGIIMNYDDDAARRTVELCYRTNKTIVNPIIDWTDEDVWDFLRSYKIPYCELYDEGFKRLGCIGCPLGGTLSQKRELERWPQYRKLYVSAFEKMIEARREAGKTEHATLWNTGEDVMRWWMGCDAKRDPDQMFMPLDEAG